MNRKQNKVENDEMDQFSKAFMDDMYAMVAEEFGEEAAKRFMKQNQDRIKPTVPDARTHAFKGAQKGKWVWRAAVVLFVVLAGFAVHKTGRVNAMKIPAANISMATTADNATAGSLKDILSALDVAGYPQEIRQIYVPQMIVEDYRETVRSDQSKCTNIIYENENGGWYQYRQMTVGLNTFPDMEKGDWKDVSVGQYPGIYIQKDTMGNLWWMDYTYVYELQGNLSEAEMIAVAKSITIEK